MKNGEARTFHYCDNGIADIIRCTSTGRFVAIEVKKKGNKPSPEQLQQWHHVGRVLD